MYRHFDVAVLLHNIPANALPLYQSLILAQLLRLQFGLKLVRFGQPFLENVIEIPGSEINNGDLDGRHMRYMLE